MSINHHSTETFSATQFDILLKLYQNAFVEIDTLEGLDAIITKSITKGLGIQYASIWLFEQDSLVCHFAYDCLKDEHEKGLVLLKTDIPIYYEALQKGLVIKVDDALEADITNEFKASYLIPNKVNSILDIPLRQNGALTGVLCCEHNLVKNWTEIEIHFA